MRHGVLFLVWVAACGGDEPQETELGPCGQSEPPVAEVAGQRAELLFASRMGNTITAGAFAGGLDANATLIVTHEDGTELARGDADEDGKVTLTFDNGPARVLLGAAGNEAALFRVREASAALSAAVCPAIDGAGSVPNDLVVAGGDHPFGVLVRSGDNAINAFDLARGLVGTGVRLPEVEDACGRRSANPWFVHALDERRVAVTGYGSGKIYIADPSAGAIERVLEPPAPVTTAAPITLARSLDVDCDGDREDTVTTWTPRTPQPISSRGDLLIAGFTSFLAPRFDAQRPAVYLPGVLAFWNLSSLATAPSALVLDAINPQEIRAFSEEDAIDPRVIVVCSGVLEQRDGDTVATTPGRVFVIDVDTRDVERTFELGDFAPGSALVAGGALWVSSITRARLRRYDLATAALVDETALGDEAVDSILRLVSLPGGLIGATSFNTDRLFVIDAKDGTVSPPPFSAPIVLGPGRPVFDGASIIARRTGRPGVDFVGPELFALASIASRVTPIELRKVIGP